MKCDNAIHVPLIVSVVNVYTITLVSGTPPTKTKLATATLTVADIGVSAYKYSLDGGALSAEIPVATKISLTALGVGLHTVSVIGKTAAGAWQVAPTDVSWTVEQAAPTTTASPAGGRDRDHLLYDHRPCTHDLFGKVHRPDHGCSDQAAQILCR